MSFTREEYADLLEKKQKNKMNGERPTLEYLVQAQVKMELLTGNQHWDIFLSYLQSALEGLKITEDQYRDKLCSSSLVDSNEIMLTKMGLAETKGQITLLEGIIALPKDIIESGEKAKAVLD